VTNPTLYIHKVFKLGCRFNTGTTVLHPVHLQLALHCRFIFVEPKRLQPPLLMDRCEDAELLLLLLLIVVGLLLLVEELADCTRSRESRGGDVAVEAVDGGEVVIGTIVVSDSAGDTEVGRPEEVCGRSGRVDDEADEAVADDRGAEKDAGRAVADMGRVALGRGPGLQEKGEMDLLYVVQVMAGMVGADMVYAGTYNVRRMIMS